MSDTEHTHESRPLGYWLKTVDRLIAAEFADAFRDEDLDRREWRLLNAVDGTVAPRRPLHRHRLRRLVERGWVAETGGDFTLTGEGRAARERLGAIVDGIRSHVTEAVPPEDLATTLASLEQIARNLGWSEGPPPPRRGDRGCGHRGRGVRGGFGPHRHQDRWGRIARFAERSYERGFAAGFTRGSET